MAAVAAAMAAVAGNGTADCRRATSDVVLLVLRLLELALLPLLALLLLVLLLLLPVLPLLLLMLMLVLVLVLLLALVRRFGLSSPNRFLGRPGRKSRLVPLPLELALLTVRLISPRTLR